MSEWQPIETAPRDGTEFLLICASAYSPQAFIGWWQDGWYSCLRPEKFVAGGVTRIIGPVSHWMPLPEPPGDAA